VPISSHALVRAAGRGEALPAGVPRVGEGSSRALGTAMPELSRPAQHLVWLPADEASEQRALQPRLLPVIPVLGPPGGGERPLPAARGPRVRPSPILTVQSQCVHLPSSCSSSSPAAVPSLRMPWQRGRLPEAQQLRRRGSEPWP